ncbi:MAG TPA: type II toxin-antitoxin system RelE/ParE family toxin [Beijerinckiaceae bacterium]|jgi:addiction module RelE/StbE family toxin
MRVRFTRRANAQLDAIFNYIAKDSPVAAAAVVERIEDRAAGLSDFPYSGKPSGEEGIRVVIATPYPYLIYYHVNAKRSEVQILRIRHGARQRRH